MSTVRIPTRQRRWPVFVIGTIVALAVLFTVMSTFVVDLLWYREVGLTGVFWTELRTKVVLGAVFGLLFFALLFANLLVARRIAPPPMPFMTPEQEAVERVRMAFEPYLGWLLPLAAGLLALLVGIGVSRQWQVFLLWRHSSGIEFGAAEPLFERDPAFYVFSLPWLKFLQGWLFSSFVGVTFLTAIAHFFLGGIRPQARTWADRVTPPTRAHLSVLLGSIMLIKAWGYYLGRFDLLTSPRGVVQGASYTDVNAQLPALNFLIIAAVICAVLFFANIVRQRWALPIIAVIVLGAVSVLLGTAYPAFVQRFRVAPQEFQREAPYIAGQHRGHDHGVRHRHRGRRGAAGAELRRHRDHRGPRGQRDDDLEHPAVAPDHPRGELPLAAANPLLLRVPRRRRRPLRARRASGGCSWSRAARCRRSASRPRRAPGRTSTCVHARLRCGRGQGQRGEHRGLADPRARRHPGALDRRTRC